MDDKIQKTEDKFEDDDEASSGLSLSRAMTREEMEEAQPELSPLEFMDDGPRGGVFLQTWPVAKAFHELTITRPEATNEDDIDDATAVVEFIAATVVTGSAGDWAVVRELYNAVYTLSAQRARVRRRVSEALTVFRGDGEYEDEWTRERTGAYSLTGHSPGLRAWYRSPGGPIECANELSKWPLVEWQAVMYLQGDITAIDEAFGNLDASFIRELLRSAASKVKEKATGRGSGGPSTVAAALCVRVGAMGFRTNDGESEADAVTRVAGHFNKIRTETRGRKLLP